ncbi:uncharacterized protein V1513DRAFT_438554 [Lipomyces chichibuensis]|uniref:uncharacterized protein n=1 Tax=Lipomyces chichibuensis TaxID=1546026 RepID=UPI0033441B10
MFTLVFPAGLQSEDFRSLYLRLRIVQRQVLIPPLRPSPETIPADYPDPYSTKAPLSDVAAFPSLLRAVTARVPLEAAANLELPFHLGDVETALSCARGPDGLPFDFYRIFCPEVGPYLTSYSQHDPRSGLSHTYTASGSPPPPMDRERSQKDGIGDWRLTRIKSQALNTRLNSLLCLMVRPQQTGFILSGWIGTNTKLIQLLFVFVLPEPSEVSHLRQD